MNRRHFLIALAVVLPVAVFIPAKLTARWRPVEVGRIHQRGLYPAPAISASSQYIEAYGPITSRLDLQTGKTDYVGFDSGFFPVGAWNWRLNKDNPRTPTRAQLELRDGNGAPVTYDIPVLTAGSQGETSAETVAFTPADNRLELVMGRRYYRWNITSRQLERNRILPVFDSSLMALSRDGETLTQAGLYEISAFSTRTGRVLRRFRFGTKTAQMPSQISAFGHYAIYDNSRVVDLQSGRTLWRFDLRVPGSSSLVSMAPGAFRVQVMPASLHYASFSPAEKLIALPPHHSNSWEIRDAQTGEITRTLPLLPGAQTGAFSPDGNTLYSVADGVLYRQRAR